MKIEVEKKYLVHGGIPTVDDAKRQVVVQWYIRTGNPETRVRFLCTNGLIQPWELAVKAKTASTYARTEIEKEIQPSFQLLSKLKNLPCSAKIRTKFEVAGTEVAIDELYDVRTMRPFLVMAEIELLDETATFEAAEAAVKAMGIELVEIPEHEQDKYKNSKLAKVYNMPYYEVIVRMMEVAGF